jgi:hypothetical protein
MVPREHIVYTADGADMGVISGSSSSSSSGTVGAGAGAGAGTAGAGTRTVTERPCAVVHQYDRNARLVKHFDVAFAGQDPSVQYFDSTYPDEPPF